MSDLSAKKRRELKPSDFGIPEKRLYPMIDAEDVTSAVSLFGKASPKYRKTLAKRILSKAKEFNVDSSGWKTIIQCAQEQVPPMSDGTSLGNAPALTIDPFSEGDELLDRVAGHIPESGSLSKYKKEDLTENRGPIQAVQEQTLVGYGASTGDEANEIPVECPDTMTDDEKFFYRVLFKDELPLFAINAIIEKLVAPFCEKNGMKDNAMTKLIRYRHAKDEDDLWENGFEHADYVWGYLYPAAKGEIKSANKALITFDSDCTYLKNTEKRRPIGYKQIVVEVTLTENGDLMAEIISPGKTSPVKILSFDIKEARHDLGSRDSRQAFYDACKTKIEAILPDDLKKFIHKNQNDTEYYYPAKYFDGLWMFDSIDRVVYSYIQDELYHHPLFKKLDPHRDWQKKIELLDDVLKDTVIPIGISDDYSDLFIQYKTSTGEIVESFHGKVLAKSWKEFESRLESIDENNRIGGSDDLYEVCKSRIEAILPDDLIKFMEENDPVYDLYSYPSKYFDELWIFRSIDDVVSEFLRYEFKYHPIIQKARHSNDRKTDIELLDEVLKDTVITFGVPTHNSGARVQYKTPSGEIVDSPHKTVLAKSWDEFKSKLKKIDLNERYAQENGDAFQEGFTDYETAMEIMYVLEEAVANNPSNPSLIRRIIDWCKRAIKFIIDKVRSLFGKNEPIKTNVDVEELNSTTSSVLSQLSQSPKSAIDTSDLERKLNQIKSNNNEPLAIADPQRVLRQLNENITKINDLLKNPDNLSQESVTALQKLLAEHMAFIKSINDAQVATTGNPAIVNALVNSINGNNSNGTVSIQVYPYLYSRTFNNDFIANGAILPKIINNSKEAHIFARKAMEGTDPRDGLVPKVIYYNNKYFVGVYGYTSDILKQAGYNPETVEVAGNNGNPIKHEKYCHDKFGRRLHMAVGYVITSDQISKNGIPAISYKMLADIYLNWAKDMFYKEKDDRKISDEVTIRSNPLKSDGQPTQESYAQEGAFQDIKNGVNPKSKKLFFHISRDDSLAQKTLEPRIPSYLINDKAQVETNEELGLHEDATTPRVCFSPSIEGCLNAIVNHGDRIHLAGQAFYVYIPTKPIGQYKHKLNREIIRDKDVFDAESTGEIWILEPVDVRLYGVIVVDQVSRMKKVPISDKETGNYVYHYTYKWHWLNKPKTLQEGAILEKKKPSRFFLEEDEEEITVGDIELEDNGDNDGDSDDKESKQDSDTIETTVSEKTEMDDDMGSDEESVDEHLDVKNVDLGSFGSDTSDVQNEYDPKEVELLMKLMSSEADAMAEYMDGAKETNVDVLRRLYADIANEERFHMEQLLYAKCELTGETYVPKDPDVKKEYEELLEMGMDEETAMHTAVDKCHINGVVIQSENEQLEEDTELQEDIETMESAMLQFNMTFDYMMEMAENSKFSAQDFYDTLDVFTEACINTDDVVMEAQQDGYVRQKKGPITVLKNAISFLLGLIGKLISKFGELLKRLGNRGHKILVYIRRYGIKGILSTNTISMYFYDMMDPTNAANTVAYFWTLVYDVYREAVKTLGIQAPTVPDEAGLLRNSRLKVNGLDDGVNKLNGVELVKTKSVLPDDPEKQAQVITYLLGYSKTKLPDGKSANIMNILMTSAEDWKRLMELMKETLGKVDALSNDQNSVYYTNKALYNKSEEALKVCVKSCKAFVNALTHDVNVLADLNKRLTGALANMKENTTEMDRADAAAAQDAQQAQNPAPAEKPADTAAASGGGAQPAPQKQQPQSGTAARALKPDDQHKLDQLVKARDELGLVDWLKSLLRQKAVLTGGKK